MTASGSHRFKVLATPSFRADFRNAGWSDEEIDPLKQYLEEVPEALMPIPNYPTIFCDILWDPNFGENLEYKAICIKIDEAKQIVLLRFVPKDEDLSSSGNENKEIVHWSYKLFKIALRIAGISKVKEILDKYFGGDFPDLPL